MVRMLLLVAMLLVSWSLPSWALTAAQLQTLKTAILATGSLADELADNNYPAIAVYYNELNSVAPTSAAFWVWRTSVPNYEIYRTVTTPGINNWSWVLHEALTTAQRDTWRDMVEFPINCALEPVREQIDVLYPDPSAQRDHIRRVCRREATRGEVVFATGTGSEAVPGFLTVEGDLTVRDISDAVNLP